MTATASFGFSLGINIKDLDAGKVLAALESIRDTEGLTPANVVDAARSPESPLHKAFEWDDSAAAALHREHQARILIKSVRVTTGNTEAPAFIHVSTRQFAAGEYERTAVVVHDESMRRDALRELREHAAAINRTIALLTQEMPMPKTAAAARRLEKAVASEARA